MSHKSTPEGAPGFFEHPQTSRWIFWGLLVACVLLGLSDLFYHKHGHFAFEETFAFHGLFGFLAYLLIVNSAKLLRRFVRRSENYYDE